MLRKRFLLFMLILMLVGGVFSAVGQDATSPLAITDVLPAPETLDVATDSTVTVIFNKPVVPLGLSSDSALDLPDPLQFDPPVAGTGEWLNTAIYLFHPDPALAGGTDYTVTVDPALTAVDGTTLAEPFTWSFKTVAPQVIQVIPENGTAQVELGAAIQVRFNQPMDLASVEGSFRLRPQGGGEPVNGSFEWADDGAGFRFQPDQLLALDTAYAIQFTSLNGLPTGESGGAELAGQTEYLFSSVPEPVIINTSPFDGQQDVYPYGGLTLYFASPMDIETLEGKITIEPEPWREYDNYYSEYDNSYTLSFPTEPSTAYTITIMPGMRDIYGNQIKEGTVVHYTTAAYDPELFLQTTGDYGFYNANNDETRLFLTHRNISQVDLELYQLNPDDLMRMMVSDTRYSQAMLSDNFTLNQQNLIKDWSIPSVAPLNVPRYEYLDLGINATETCAGAPPSRVHVGDTIQVITQPDPLRVRSEPLTGAILNNVNAGYTAPVVGGPSCVGNFTWWQVELQDGQTGWLAEGDQTEYYIEVAVPAAITPVDVTDSDGNALAPGVYFLNATAPEVDYPRQHILIVGNANLVMKNSVDSVLIWATDVSTGLPIPNAPVTVYDRQLNAVASGTTDADGLFTAATPRTPDLYAPTLASLDTDDYFGLGASEWSSGLEGYYFDANLNYYPDPYTAYVYTDRPLYRPGQPVYYRGIVRGKDDVTYSAPDFTTVPVRIYDPENILILETTATLTPAGTFSGQFDIADDAALGFYRLDAQVPSEDPEANYTSIGVISFGVAEYRLPEFQVTVTPDLPEVTAGETISVLVDSRFYFGGAVSDANVQYNVISQPFYFDYAGSVNYTFTDFDADGTPSDFYGSSGGLVTSGEVTTDAQGQAVITFPADLGESRQSLTFTIETTVTDESGQAVSGRADVIVHKGDFYIGVAPEEYVGMQGEANNFDVIVVDWEGEPVEGVAVDLEFVERRWASVQEQDASGRTTWTYEVEEIPVDSVTVTTDADGQASASFTPPNGGVFKLKATARDEGGNEVISAVTTWVSSTDYVAWRMQNSNRIDLIADKTEYNIGETAEILIASPFQGATEALVTVERGDTLFWERIQLEGNSTVYQVPILPEYAPNIYVSVFITKGIDETNPVAAFRMGLIGLLVETTRRELNVDIQPNVAQAGPGDTVEYTITTTDFAGEPVQTELGVAVTDLASLSIADANQIDLLNYFFGLQGLGVRTSSLLTINVDQLTQETLDTVKGGGGGFGEGGIFDIREDFVDTAYWNPSVVTDNDGVATVEVTLPDNLTTWRLDARAVTMPEAGELRVGQETFDLISTKPLLIRPVTPRFFVAGDEVTLAAIVNNNTDRDLDVNVVMSSESGVTFLDESNGIHRITIAAGTRQRVEFPVRIETVPGQEGIDLMFTAVDSANEFNDASIPPLAQNGVIPVIQYEVPETVGTAGVISAEETRTEGIVLPTEYPITTGSLDIEIEPSLAASTLDALDVLKRNSSRSIEGVVSRFLPNIMTTRALEGVGLADQALSDALDFEVNLALQELYAQQKPDGGWGWYVQERSSPLITAYALIGLSEARDQGYAVAPEVISGAQGFLRSAFITASVSSETWQLNRQAFVLYALARSGDPDVSRTANLYEFRDRLAIYAKSFLALTFDLIDSSDQRADTLLSDLVNSATLSATGVHWTEAERDYWNWNTDTRSTAVALAAFVRINPTNDLIPNIVRYLVSQRTADLWETTQETAWSVMALTDYMVAANDIQPEYSYDIELNSEAIANGDITPADARDTKPLSIDIAQLLSDAVNELTITRSAGRGNLYYRAFLTAYLPVPSVEPLENGIVISRRYVVDGETVDSAAVGDNVQVRLTIIAPTDLHYVVVEDPIPAGSDAVNPDLNTSQQVGTQPELNPEDPLSQGWGWWFFSNIEFRDEKVTLSAEYLPAGTYEFVYTIRAGLAGTFNVIPPTASEFYFPEVNGRGAGSTFTINP